MSESQLELRNVERMTGPDFAGVPRWLVAVLLVMGPSLQVIEFLLANNTDDTAVQLAFWSEFPSRTGLSMASGLLAVPFLLAANAVIVALTRAHSRRLAWLGGAFMTFGMVGLAAAHGYEIAAFGLLQAGNPAGAASILNTDHLGLPGAILLIMFLGGAALGTLALATAEWRSPYAPRIVALFMLAFALLDFLVGQAVISHLVNLVGFAILAVAVLTEYSRPSRTTNTPAIRPGS